MSQEGSHRNALKPTSDGYEPDKNAFALTGAEILHNETLLQNHAIIINKNEIQSVLPETKLPESLEKQQLNGGMLIPGLIDLQVNGGGGVLFNHSPSVETISTICKAHQKLGTSQLLVTLISADSDTTEKAIAAAISASKANVPGFLGLHLEGPHLSIDKKGAHSEKVLRPMSEKDIQALCVAKQKLPYMMITVAPEVVGVENIKRLAAAGIIVSLGHSNANYAQATDAYSNGATCATHLYNAMSPLNHREPGLVGATLEHANAYSGLIADGVHVHPAAIQTALKAKNDSGKLFIVSDAMATAGSQITEFELDDRTIVRKQGRLELKDGTLAGADTDMLASIRYLVNAVGVDKLEAIRMGTLYPSACIGALDQHGSLVAGQTANILHVNEQLEIQQIWMNGERA